MCISIRFRVKASSKKSYEPEMVFVEGGSFIMGSEDFNDDEKPVHEVILSSFSIGRFEVTQTRRIEVSPSVTAVEIALASAQRPCG